VEKNHNQLGTNLKKVGLIAALIGGLVGAALTYFLFPKTVTKYDNVVTESRVVDTVYVEKERVVYQRVEVVKEKPQTELEDVKIDSVIKDTVVLEDSIKIVKEDTVAEVEVVETEDTIEVIPDTLSSSAQVIVKSGDDNIHVAKNEMVYSQFIVPEGNPSDFYCNSDGELDSLLVGNYIKKAKNKGVYVEFWSSPINLTGYQLSKKKLVLFGFYEYKNVKLRYLSDGRIRMTYFDNIYNLSCGGEFIPLIIKKNKN